MKNNKLQQIHAFADKAHGQQVRKYTGERFIHHPQRVMETVAEYSQSLPVLAAALLHDVLEDTETTAPEILSFLAKLMEREQAQRTLKLVQELTDVYEKQYYPQWNRQKRKQMEAERLAKVSAEAQTIKYADIMDNCGDIMENEPGFGIRYAKESKALLQKMQQGHAQLRERALKRIEQCLQS